MAAAIGPHGTARVGGSELPKPSALVLLYTGHLHLASTEPPTFVAVGESDVIAPPVTMQRRVAAVRRLGTDVEYRKYPPSATASAWVCVPAAEGWIGDAVRFWAKHIGGQK